MGWGIIFILTQLQTDGVGEIYGKAKIPLPEVKDRSNFTRMASHIFPFSVGLFFTFPHATLW